MSGKHSSDFLKLKLSNNHKAMTSLKLLRLIIEGKMTLSIMTFSIMILSIKNSA
jgi:hypothetical protein